MAKSGTVKLKANDQLHISSVRADTIRAGEAFDVSEPVAKSLVDRGLATRIGGAKAAEKPKNKADAKPKNKSA